MRPSYLNVNIRFKVIFTLVVFHKLVKLPTLTINEIIKTELKNMKLVRQIIFILAALSAFIYLTIFSAIEYNGEESDFSTAEDRLPIAKEAIKGVAGLVSIMEKIPLLRLIPTDLEKVNLDKSKLEESYEDIDFLVEAEETSDLSVKYSGDFSYTEPLQNIKETTWPDFLKGLKDRLSGNWFSS